MASGKIEWVYLKCKSFNDKMLRLGADGLKNGLILSAAWIKEKLKKNRSLVFIPDKLGNSAERCRDNQFVFPIELAC